MRKDRRIGGPVRESTADRGAVAVVGIDRVTAAGDRELDERGVGGVDIVGPWGDGIVFVGAGAADAALDQELDVHAAPLVVAEAVVERVAEGVEAEVPRAAGVGAIQERAVVALVGHGYICRLAGFIPDSRSIGLGGDRT
jgi:hypothetical protein